MKRGFRIFIVLIFLLTPVAFVAQDLAPSEPTQISPRPDSGPWTKDQIREMQRKQREMRQKQLKDDTAKLLQLATELKESVDKTNEHVLSLEVVRKAEEIEKLAKHIKTNMRDEAR